MSSNPDKRSIAADAELAHSLQVEELGGTSAAGSKSAKDSAKVKKVLVHSEILKRIESRDDFHRVVEE